MSNQATAWAIEQTTGSPSHKVTLWSIANYANKNWCSYPGQELIAKESEQSVDSVQRRLVDLIERKLLRRIKLKRFGRRTHDFFILPPSPFFSAAIEDIRPLLPAGADVLEDEEPAKVMAADCGSVEPAESPTPSNDSNSDAAADCGHVTLPQSAVDATALLRQQEPFIEPVTQPQTPSQPQEANQGSQTKVEPDLSGLDRFRETYPRPSAKPAEDAAMWAALDPTQRAQAQHGARGARRIFEKNPKSSGVVGPTRYLQSSPLWAEYGRFAPVETAPPPPRHFVAAGSEEWHARTVLCAITGATMPSAKHDPAHNGDGADFMGALPQGGLVLAQFVDQFGNADPSTWPIIDRDKNPQQIGAWRERIRECTGREIELQRIDLGAVKTVNGIEGRSYTIPRVTLGLRVPDMFPPPKGERSHGLTESEAQEFADTG